MNGKTELSGLRVYGLQNLKVNLNVVFHIAHSIIIYFQCFSTFLSLVDKGWIGNAMLSLIDPTSNRVGSNQDELRSCLVNSSPHLTKLGQIHIRLS